MSALVNRYLAAYNRLPLRLRQIIADLFLAAVAAVGAFTFVVPTSVASAREQGVTLAVSVAYAVLGVLRREFWPFLVQTVLAALTPPAAK